MINSVEFVYTIACLLAVSNVILVIFDVVSLFTKVPIGDAFSLLGRRFVEESVSSAKLCKPTSLRLGPKL